MNQKIFGFILILLLITLININSQEIELDLIKDSILLGTGITYAVLSEWLVSSIPLSVPEEELSIESLGFFDKWAVF